MSEWSVSGADFEDLIQREWLIVNHLGGYASSTACGTNTRKYHGLLVAAMSPPVRRMVLLSRVEETLVHRGWPNPLSTNEYPGAVFPHGYQALKAVDHYPHMRWGYQGDGWTLEKELYLLKGRNTVCLRYTLQGASGDVQFSAQPLLALRGIHELMYQSNGALASVKEEAGRFAVAATARTPEVFFAHDGAFKAGGSWYLNTIYRHEQERGYGGLEDLWVPGAVEWALEPGKAVHLICSAEPIELDEVLAELDELSRPTLTSIISPPGKHEADDLTLLVRAVSQFEVAVEREGSAVEHSTMTVFPWGAPSIRQMLMAFTGLHLVTGRFDAARAILLRLAGQLERGTMPAQWPEDGSAPTGRSADVSLWWINALWDYLRYTTDKRDALPRDLLGVAQKIIRDYAARKDSAIHVNADGLLVQKDGQATSWMDTAIDGTLVTPRQGSPVELEALWYNALRIVSALTRRDGQARMADEFDAMADKAQGAFNRLFWNELSGCCFDVIDGNYQNPSIRPNQLLTISLPFAILNLDRHALLMNVVRQELLTPVGLRSLASSDPSYQGRYAGHEQARDRAFHQGSVWPWFLGPMATAVLRLEGRHAGARHAVSTMIEGCLAQMRGRSWGQIGELFDGDAPHRPGGAPAAALNAGCLLRAYVEEVLDQQPLVAHTTPGSVLPTVINADEKAVK